MNNQEQILITCDNHPFRHDIIGLEKEYLLNRLPYVKSAINFWTKNIEGYTKEIVDYNLNYFNVELDLIESELSEIEKKTK